MAININLDTKLVINPQTDDYTLVLADGNNKTLVRMNKASAVNLTVPLNADVAFPIGTSILLEQTGAGQVTIVPDSGVTINSVGGALKTFGRYSCATLIKVATNTWTLSGSITV